MHAGQHAAHGPAVHSLRRRLPASLQARDDRCRLTIERIDDLALLIRNRRWHPYIALGEMPHQVQVERQLFETEFFEQGEYELAAIRGEKKIAVLDPGGDAFQ